MGYIENPASILEKILEIRNKCSVEECEDDSRVKGLCQKHYLRLKKRGSLVHRTRLDPNEFVDCGDYWEIKLYNNKGNHVASTKHMDLS